MPSLRSFRRMSGLPDSIRRWKDAACVVRRGQQAIAIVNELKDSKRNRGGGRAGTAPEAGEAGVGVGADPDAASNLPAGATVPAGSGRTEAPMPNSITVDWRAVASNAPSKTMPRSVPWVHGLIRDANGPSPRIELAPKRRKGDRYPVHLIMAHPDQAAAEAMGWDATFDLTIDGHTVSAQKSMGPAYGWCEPEPWALVAELDADHPLVIHAAEAAKGPQAAMDQAQDDFYAAAREWGDTNFPHPDFMNVVRSLMLSEWQHAPGYWPGDPLPDVEAICEKAREQLRA